ncbi:MAG: peptide deformylase [Clostridia bacterium]
MAIREIVLEGDEILRKKTKKVDKIDDRIKQLIEDMWETMYKYDGIGLAAPQVGILKRIIVYDIGEGKHALINPEIISASGEQWCEEGCLSLPNIFGDVRRPSKLVIRGIDENGEYVTIKAKELLAVCLSHETDHLEGVLFTDSAENIHEGIIEEETKTKKKK